MNCAAVDVLGSNTGALELPQMFEANHFGPSECTTPEVCGLSALLKRLELTNCLILSGR